MHLAGVLHDIGKIGIPDSILKKPGALDEDEWTEMRKHPELGARILQGAHLDDIAGWVLAHHERPDGQGYPMGLSGDRIPIQARILAVSRRIRGDDERPRLPAGDARVRGARRARALLGHAVRSGHRRHLREAARARGPLRRVADRHGYRGRCDERAPDRAAAQLRRPRRLPRRGHGRRPPRDEHRVVPDRARDHGPRAARAARRAARHAGRVVDPVRPRRRLRAAGPAARADDGVQARHGARDPLRRARRRGAGRLALRRPPVAVHVALPDLDGRRRRVASAAPHARDHRGHLRSSRSFRSSTTTGRASSPATWRCGS